MAAVSPVDLKAEDQAREVFPDVMKHAETAFPSHGMRSHSHIVEAPTRSFGLARVSASFHTLRRLKVAFTSPTNIRPLDFSTVRCKARWNQVFARRV